MLFVKDMKNLKVYRREFFLPTKETDKPVANKKTGSAIFLLTPNKTSSMKLMDHPLAVNRLRFQSYYMEKDVSYYIYNKEMKEIEEQTYLHDLDYDQVLTEFNPIKTRENLKYNLDNLFKYKVLWITGFSGSGKTSYSKKLEEANPNTKVERISLDLFSTALNHHFGKETYRDNLAILNSLPDPNYIKIYFNSKPKLNNKSMGAILEDFGLWLEERAKKENVLFIVEGIQIGYMRGEFFTDRPLIIIGTSALSSYFRRHKRDLKSSNYDSESFKAIFKSIGLYKNNSKLFDNLTKSIDLANNRKVLVAEDCLDDIEDCTELVIEAAEYDNLKDKLKFSGYNKDVMILAQIFTPELYANLMSEYFGITDTSKLPEMHISTGAFPTGMEYFTIDARYTQGPEAISVHVPNYTGTEDKMGYANRVLNFIIKSIMITYYPDLENTRFPAILADTLTDADSTASDMGEYLFSAVSGNPLMDIGAFVTCCKNKKYNEIFNLLKQKYTNLKIDDIVYGVQVHETREYITPFNLQRKFKYASTTKFKAQMTRRSGALRRLARKINFSTPLNIPQVGTNINGLQSAPPVAESYILNSDMLNSITEGVDYSRYGDLVIFNEDTTQNATLKRLLYAERIKYTKDIIAINKQMRIDKPWIKYAYPDLARYQGRNLFVDLYYYNDIFFKNNTYQAKKGYTLYLTLLDRLINDPRIKAAGYDKRTVFVPVLDWDHSKDTKMYMYREDINPISIIYELMLRDNAMLKKVFGKLDVIFFDNDKYFKINFSEIKPEDMKKSAMKFRTFISKMENREIFDPEDEDTSANDTPEAVRSDIYDKIEASKGVDLTPSKSIVDNAKEEVESKKKNASKTDIKLQTGKDSTKDIEQKLDDKKISKGVDVKKEKERQERLQSLVQAIDDSIDNTSSGTTANTDKVLDDLGYNQMAVDLLSNLSSDAPGGVNMDATRAARINTLTDQFLQKDVKGRTVKEILEENPIDKPIKKVTLDIDTPNDDWKELTYINFDKNYDLDRDVLASFKHFATVSYPLAVRNIKVTDTSTSENRVNTYDVDLEDYKGKRVNVKLDIPIIIDNRFLLRGNQKVISSQFFNMPILKTDLDAAQINTNYQKIFIYRFRNNTGCSNPTMSILIKALDKYQGTIIKIKKGDNKRVSNKYQLPIDYIDISTVINTIEIKKKDRHEKYYFNQDEIRTEHPEINNLSQSVLYVGWDYITNKPIEFANMKTCTFAEFLYSQLITADPNFRDVIRTCKASTRGTYSQCSIMSTRMPLVIVAAFHGGLNIVLSRSGIEYEWTEKITNDIRSDISKDFIKFKDGYLVYRLSYDSAMLLNGLKDCPTDEYTMGEMDQRLTYIDFMSQFGGRIKADGIENFYDCLIDPITKEILEYYKLPTDFLGLLLYGNALMADNKYVKHTDTSSRRVRRAEMVAAYTYSVLADAYAKWVTPIRNGNESEGFFVKRSAVIDELLKSPISQDSSVNNALGAVEETNTITFKGKSGLNSARAYSLDKRTYDESMINVLGQSTGFSANVGISRVATMNMNVEGVRGFIRQSYSDVENMNTANTLTATESMIPFEASSDDSTRVSMSYVQTAKHAVRTDKSDPPLVTSGSEQALPYMTTDTFAFKAKEDGKIKELTDRYILVEYKSGKTDYINLTKTIEKNSDGGYYVPMQLIANKGIRQGSSIKENDILAYDPKSFSRGSLGESDKLSYNTGRLSKVAILSSDDGFEDSGICTEKLAKDLTTQVIYEFDHVLEKESNVYHIAKIGSYVNVGDPLLIWQDPFEDEDANALLKYVNTKQDALSTIGRRTILSETTGTVADIKIYRTCEINEMSESLQKIVKAYEKPIKELKSKLEESGLSTSMLPATYALEPTGKLKKAQDALIIEIYVEHDDIVGVGDKIVYLAANKAVIKTVIPKGKEPYTDFRPDEEISACLSVSSINHRMVTSIIKNGILNKLLIELDRSCKDMAGIKYDTKNL